MRRSRFQRTLIGLLLCVLVPHLVACASTRSYYPTGAAGADDRDLPRIQRGDLVELVLLDGRIVYGKVGRITRDAIQVGGEWIERADIGSASGRETGGSGFGVFVLAAIGMVGVILVFWGTSGGGAFGPSWAGGQ